MALVAARCPEVVGVAAATLCAYLAHRASCKHGERTGAAVRLETVNKFTSKRAVDISGYRK